MQFILGYYAFIETSSPRRTGDKAWLLSDQLAPTTGSCLTFWYSMYGSGRFLNSLQNGPKFF